VAFRLEKAPCDQSLENLGNVSSVNVRHLPKSQVRDPSFEIRRDEGLKLKSLETVETNTKMGPQPLQRFGREQADHG